MAPTLAASADTWGISGPTFLIAYAVLAVAVLVAGVTTRRRLADPRVKHHVGDISTRPHDVAFLNGGAELAVYSALSSMHLHGTIVSARGNLRAAGRLDPDADELERAIHFTAGSGAVHRKRLPFHRPVATALTAVENRLSTAGLLLPAAQRRGIRAVGGWMLAVAGLGLVRILAGMAEAKPFGFLLVMMLVVVVVGAVQLFVAPRRSRLGDRTLRELRDRHHGLAPATRPDWAVYGPDDAALSIGIFGTTALWASDPAFADEIDAQRVAAGGGSDGGGGFSVGDSGGGDSGGGGGGGDGGGGGGGGCGGGCGS